MADLRVRTYNVKFGDAILISVPDRQADGTPITRHILIDVGNILSGPGGVDTPFRRIVENVQEEIGDRPLDLYIMTHEHMDHVQGLLYAAEKEGLELDVDTVWMTASSEGDPYYDRFPEAKRRFELTKRFFGAIERQLAAAPTADRRRFEALMLNNNPRRTADCVDYIRELTDNVHFVHRGYAIDDAHPFRDARFEIWAPEEDTSDYYGSFHPLAFGFMGARAGRAEPATDAAVLARPKPPHGVDTSAFYDLIRSREAGVFANALAIDKAKNNTSVVFMLEWRGWRLLFPGDAESRSWRTMERENVLKTVHLLKVAHHGSHNGTPSTDILDKILPIPDPDGAERCALLSTCEGAYNNVPHKPTIDELKRRCTVDSTEEDDLEYLDLLFPE